MKWFIPAKTFLVGEYVATQKGPAIILLTTSCFELSLIPENKLEGIHPDSPAGFWWRKQNHHQGLHWYDPYKKGGLGASSAQFVGAFLADHYLKGKEINPRSLLDNYYSLTHLKLGTPPSGYDVLAQTMSLCAYINQKKRHSKRL